MSPYLFVLCMEVLGYKIQKVVQQGQWKPCKLSCNSPAISHLFFADDLLLFGEATTHQMEVMAKVLGDFCTLSGQKLNAEKSRI